MTNPIQGEERKGAKAQGRKEEMGFLCVFALRLCVLFPVFQPSGEVTK